MVAPREPVIGRWYSVICPTCYANVTFDCRSLTRYGVECSGCGTMIDLRNPGAPLNDGDSGQLPEDAAVVVKYSPEVEDSDGLSATAQVNMVMEKVEEEKRKVMPKVMTGETRQAFSAQRNQAMADKFSFFYPVTYTIEYLVFGRVPDAKIGHVRIFRKKIPFLGWRNIPVPKTSTSYAAPCSFTFLCFLSLICFCNTLDQEWTRPYMMVEWVLVLLFYFLVFRLVYCDPGYVRPGYVDDPSWLNDELTLKDIESNQRESLWENVNGVPMERKWCATCNMHRPVRAAHCYLCGLCCYDHDHHCTVIGACVGRRKVELFAFFVWVASSAVILPVYIVVTGYYHHSHLLSTFQFYAYLLMLPPLLLFSVVLPMTGVGMCQSVVTDETTRERLQGVYLAKRNPYNRGVVRNIIYHLFQRRVQPSLFDDEFVKICAMRYAKRDLGTGTTITCF